MSWSFFLRLASRLSGITAEAPSAAPAPWRNLFLFSFGRLLCLDGLWLVVLRCAEE